MQIEKENKTYVNGELTFNTHSTEKIYMDKSNYASMLKSIDQAISIIKQHRAYLAKIYYQGEDKIPTCSKNVLETPKNECQGNKLIGNKKSQKIKTINIGNDTLKLDQSLCTNNRSSKFYENTTLYWLTFYMEKFYNTSLLAENDHRGYVYKIPDELLQQIEISSGVLGDTAKGYRRCLRVFKELWRTESTNTDSVMFSITELSDKINHLNKEPDKKWLNAPNRKTLIEEFNRLTGVPISNTVCTVLVNSELPKHLQVDPNDKKSDKETYVKFHFLPKDKKELTDISTFVRQMDEQNLSLQEQYEKLVSLRGRLYNRLKWNSDIKRLLNQNGRV